MGNFFFIKSLAIVPRGTSKKKIWLGTFFGSVLTIFISFSGSVIVFSGLVIDTADSYMLQKFHNFFRCSVNVPRTRNSHNGLVKIQQRIHKEIRCFIIVRKKNVTYKKCGCFLLRSENNYWDAGKITDPRWRLHFARLSKGP